MRYLFLLFFLAACGSDADVPPGMQGASDEGCAAGTSFAEAFGEQNGRDCALPPEHFDAYWSGFMSCFEQEYGPAFDGAREAYCE